MNRKLTEWSAGWIFIAVLFLSFSASAETWLKVSGSEEVSIKSYGFIYDNPRAVLVVSVEGGSPGGTVKGCKDTYEFTDKMADVSSEYQAILQLIVSGVEQEKKFRIAVSSIGHITKILVVN